MDNDKLPSIPKYNHTPGCTVSLMGNSVGTIRLMLSLVVHYDGGMNGHRSGGRAAYISPWVTWGLLMASPKGPTFLDHSNLWWGPRIGLTGRDSPAPILPTHVSHYRETD